MKKKSDSQRKHAKLRALQRYDIDFTRTEHDALVRRIQNGEGQFVERQSHRISVFKIDVQGQTVKVVYDKQRKTIVTFLPLEERVYAQLEQAGVDKTS